MINTQVIFSNYHRLLTLCPLQSLLARQRPRLIILHLLNHPMLKCPCMVTSRQNPEDIQRSFSLPHPQDSTLNHLIRGNQAILDTPHLTPKDHTLLRHSQLLQRKEAGRCILALKDHRIRQNMSHRLPTLAPRQSLSLHTSHKTTSIKVTATKTTLTNQHSAAMRHLNSLHDRKLHRVKHSIPSLMNKSQDPKTTSIMLQFRSGSIITNSLGYCITSELRGSIVIFVFTSII
jgi:hypothetical protein